MRMRSFLLVVIFLCANAFLKGQTAGYDWGKVTDLGPGVQNIRLDERGKVKSLVVVGEARISTVLGMAKGKRVATQRARMNAKAELVKFLRERVVSVEQDQEETIIQLKGDGKSVTEEGKSVEHTLTKVERVAEGMIRGMITIHIKVTEPAADGSQMLRVILGWSAKSNKVAKQVRSAIDAPLKGRGTGNNPGSPSPNPPASAPKTIPAQSVTSPSASEFE